MTLLVAFVLPFVLGVVAAQHDHQYSTTTPVPILKQINRHNEDGSYSYGYEAADGSYKIESKYPTGEVYGKYGFVDDSGSVREIEYGASSRGFEPTGTGINVPPPTLTGNSIVGSTEPDDDGQYHEDPSVYYTDPKYTNGERYNLVPRRPSHQPHYQQNATLGAESSPAPFYREFRNPQPAPDPQYEPQEYRPQFRSQLQPKYETQYQPAIPTTQTRFQGQPAPYIDLNAGSYTVNYKR